MNSEKQSLPWIAVALAVILLIALAGVYAWVELTRPSSPENPPPAEASPYTQVDYNYSWFKFDSFSNGNESLLIFSVNVTNQGYEYVDLNYATFKVNVSNVVYSGSYSIGGGSFVYIPTGTAYLMFNGTLTHCAKVECLTWLSQLGYPSGYLSFTNVKLLNRGHTSGYLAFEMPLEHKGLPFTISLNCNYFCTPDNSNVNLKWSLNA